MRDPSAPAKRRDEMAKAAAPFLHSKLASIENPKIQEGSRLDGKRVNPGFDIGEVLQKKRSHIGVDLIAIRDRQIGPRTTPRFLTFLPARSRRAGAGRGCAQHTTQRAAAGEHHRLNV
jgi:hypothetical protein